MNSKNHNILWDPKRAPKIIVVMPAYYAEKTVKQTYDDLPKDLISEIILVDDASTDRTVDVAKKLGLTVFKHEKNKGYGGNQKTCYDQALKRNPDIIVMVHPDYQYDPKLLGVLCEPIVNGRADFMLGSRIQSRKQALAGGMPRWKYYSNRFLTMFENIALGINMSEFHSGYRAYNAKSLKKLPYHKFSDDFVFDQEILISAVSYGLTISDTPVPCKYFPEASSINFMRSATYGLMTLWTVFLFHLHNLGIIKSKMFKPLSAGD